MEGLKIYAVGDGYVSRIKISTAGYGKAIYITHPNGYTTVYGHLQRAVGAIEEKIKAEQYKEKAYEVEVFLKQNELLVKKGDLIAFSGNTGGSEGPHLHFEFRESSTEKTVNPFFFYKNFSSDTKSPSVNNLTVYPLSNESVVNKSMRPVSVNLSLKSAGNFVADKVLAKGKIGFGVSCYDIDNVSYNSNGIYQAELSSNGKTAFKCTFDKISFDEARFINAYVDYARYKTMKNRVQKLFMKKPFGLSNITCNDDHGVIDVNSNYNQTSKIDITDFYGNKTTISIPVQFSDASAIITSDVVKTPYFVKSSREYLLEKDNITVTFPEGAFYDDFYLNFDVKDNLVTLHKDIVPVHKAFTLNFNDVNLPQNELEKTFIVSVNNNKVSYLTTKRVGKTLSTSSKTFGQFKLAKDESLPKVAITKAVEGKWISSQSNISFTISDDLSGIKSYNGYLNGKWILFEYEPKLKRITHSFSDGIVAEGENILKLIVTDNAGNSTTFETKFLRSQKK
jgi:hypothetical protein